MIVLCTCDFPTANISIWHMSVINYWAAFLVITLIVPVITLIAPLYVSMPWSLHHSAQKRGLSNLAFESYFSYSTCQHIFQGNQFLCNNLL